MLTVIVIFVAIAAAALVVHVALPALDRRERSRAALRPTLARLIYGPLRRQGPGGRHLAR